MNLTPTQQLHYDAIDEKIKSDFIVSDDGTVSHTVLYSSKIKSAQACAKITEQEKLKFAQELLGMDNPWPLVDVLKKLSEASEILLSKHNYDGHAHEQIQLCIQRAKEIEQHLQQQLNELGK